MELREKLKPFVLFTFFFFLHNTPAQAANTSDTFMGDKILSILEPLVDLISSNPWVKGATVILITLIVTSFLTWLLFKVLRRITHVTNIDIDDQVVIMLRPPVYWTFLTAGIYAGLDLMPLGDNVSLLFGRGIRTVGVVIWIYFFTRLATLLLTRLASLTHRYSFIQNRTLTLFDNAAKVLIFGLGIYAIFVIWKIDMTAWLASAGIAGIAIGFAAKDTLSNLFSGVFILADAPYKVGDYIVLDQGNRGMVTNIGLRSTRLLTRDDIEITIPNSIIGNSTITNQSGGRHKKMRIRLKVGVAYGTDVDMVRSILMEIATSDKHVCKIPEPRVRFRIFGASSLDFELLCWVTDPELRGRAMDSLNDAVYKKFAEQNIEIPYSKQDLYIKGLPEQLSGKIPDTYQDKKADRQE